jgi:hypothetical protein
MNSYLSEDSEWPNINSIHCLTPARTESERGDRGMAVGGVCGIGQEQTPAEPAIVWCRRPSRPQSGDQLPVSSPSPAPSRPMTPSESSPLCQIRGIALASWVGCGLWCGDPSARWRVRLDGASASMARPALTAAHPCMCPHPLSLSQGCPRAARSSLQQACGRMRGHSSHFFLQTVYSPTWRRFP